MKLCYQVATPDVAIADSVTAYQGPLEKSFSDLAKLGYQGVELMTLNPSELDWDFVKSEAEKNGKRQSAEVRRSSTLLLIWEQISTSGVSADSTARS